jgi:hypothetical protein
MTAADHGNAELIASRFDAVLRKGASAVDRYFDPNVEYVVNGTPSSDPTGVLPRISEDCHAALPWLCLYRGREALMGFLGYRITAHPRSAGAALGRFAL